MIVTLGAVPLTATVNEKGVGAGVADAGVIRIAGRITTMNVENSRTASVAMAPSRVTSLCATHLP